MTPRKIAIVGISGSGKSTFARKLGNKLNLPVFHMDPLFWKGNWQAVPEAEYLEEHRKLVEKDAWIIEGYIDEKMTERVKQADLVVYLDYSGLLSAWRYIKRVLKHRKVSRPEFPKKSLEKFSFRFFKIVLTRSERKDIEKALENVNKSKVVRFASPKELQKFCDTINS